MIQRIQTIYLLVAFVLIVVSMFVPFVSFTSEAARDAVSVTLLGANNLDGECVRSMWPALVLAAINAALCIVAIMMYRRRVAQIRVTIYNAVLLVGTVVMTMVMTSLVSSQLSDYTMHLMPISIAPLFELVMMIFAIRAIRHDEELVRSADRLR